MNFIFNKLQLPMQVQSSYPPISYSNQNSSISNSSSENDQGQIQQETININNSMTFANRNNSSRKSSPKYHIPSNSDNEQQKKERPYFTKQQIFNHEIVYVNSDEFSNSPSFLRMSMQNTPILRKKDSPNYNTSGMLGINSNSTNTVPYIANFNQSNQLDNTIKQVDSSTIKSESEFNKQKVCQQKTIKKQEKDVDKSEKRLKMSPKQQKVDENNESPTDEEETKTKFMNNKKKVNPRNLRNNRNLNEYQIQNIIKIVDNMYQKAIDQKIKVQVNLQIESKSLQKIRRQKQNNLKDKNIIINRSKQKQKQKQNQTQKIIPTGESKINITQEIQNRNKKQNLQQIANLRVTQKDQNQYQSKQQAQSNIQQINPISVHINANQNQSKTTYRCSINLQQLKLMKQINQIYSNECNIQEDENNGSNKMGFSAKFHLFYSGNNNNINHQQTQQQQENHYPQQEQSQQKQKSSSQQQQRLQQQEEYQHRGQTILQFQQNSNNYYPELESSYNKQEYKNYKMKYYDIIVNQNDDDKGLSATQRVSIQVLPEQYRCKEQQEDQQHYPQYSYKQFHQHQPSNCQNIHPQNIQQKQLSDVIPSQTSESKINTNISSQKWFKTDSQPEQNRVISSIHTHNYNKITYQVHKCPCQQHHQYQHQNQQNKQQEYDHKKGKKQDQCKMNIKNENNTNKKRNQKNNSCRKVYIKKSPQLGTITPIKNNTYNNSSIINHSHINININSLDNSANNSNSNSKNKSNTKYSNSNGIGIRLIELDPNRSNKFNKNNNYINVGSKQLYGNSSQRLSNNSKTQNQQTKPHTKSNSKLKNINYTLIKYEQNQPSQQPVNFIKYSHHSVHDISSQPKTKENSITPKVIINTHKISLPTQVYTNLNAKSIHNSKQFQPHPSANLLQLCADIKQEQQDNPAFTQRKPSPNQSLFAYAKVDSGSVTERYTNSEKTKQNNNNNNNINNKYDLNIQHSQNLQSGAKTDRSGSVVSALCRPNKNINRKNQNKVSGTKNSSYKGVYEEILSQYSTAKLLAISKQQYSNDNPMNNLGLASGTGSIINNRGNVYPHSQNSSTIKNSHLFETYNNHNEPLSINKNINNYNFKQNSNSGEIGSIIKNNHYKNINKNMIKNTCKKYEGQYNGGMDIYLRNQQQPVVCYYGNSKNNQKSGNWSKTGRIIGSDVNQQYCINFNKPNKYYFQKNV